MRTREASGAEGAKKGYSAADYFSAQRLAAGLADVEGIEELPRVFAESEFLRLAGLVDRPSSAAKVRAIFAEAALRAVADHGLTAIEFRGIAHDPGSLVLCKPASGMSRDRKLLLAFDDIATSLPRDLRCHQLFLAAWKAHVKWNQDLGGRTPVASRRVTKDRDGNEMATDEPELVRDIRKLIHSAFGEVTIHDEREISDPQPALREKGSQQNFVIDLDGSWNFNRGGTAWTLQLCLVEGALNRTAGGTQLSDVSLAAIGCPSRNLTIVWDTKRQSSPEFLVNGKYLSKADWQQDRPCPSNLKDAVIAVPGDLTKQKSRRDDVVRLIDRTVAVCDRIRVSGSIGVDLLDMLMGTIDVRWSLSCNPSDMAAAVMIQATGGAVLTADGKPWEFGCSTMLCARSHELAIATVNEIIQPEKIPEDVFRRSAW